MIEYGAAICQPFYRNDGARGKAGSDHFYFKLRSLMNTDAGRRLAVQREPFMQTFLQQFEHEVGVMLESRF